MNRLSLFALLTAALLARPAAAQTLRRVQDKQLFIDLQGELALKNGDYLLLSVFGQNTPAYNYYTDNRRLLGFDTRGLGLAYEHFWSTHWSGGAAFAQQSQLGNNYIIPELLLRHRSALGPLTFGQRLSGYRTIAVGNTARFGNPEGLNFLSLRADLEKLFPMGAVGLRPRLSYEAGMNVHLQKDKNAPDFDQRTIQYTSLRAEVGFRFGDHFDLTPWFAYTTAYYFTIPQYNPISGTPTTGGGRLNLITPIIGLDARFTLFAGKTVFERQQLPTQH